MKPTHYSIQKNSLCDNIHYVFSSTERALPNSEFEVHTHYNELEIYFFLEGDLFFAFEGNRYEVENGQMILIADGTLHKPIIKAPCRYVRKRIFFDKTVLTGLNADAYELYARLGKQKALVINAKTVKDEGFDILFDEIECSLEQKTSQDSFSALISLLSLLIKAERLGTPLSSGSFHTANESISEIIKFIDNNLSGKITYKTIAQKFYIPEKSLYKYFKTETGFTLSGYITERRIIKAQSALGAGLSAQEASVLSGFGDYSVFYRNFKARVGMTPTEYAKKARTSSNKNID